MTRAPRVPAILGVILGVLVTGCGGGLRGRVADAAHAGDFEGAWTSYEAVRASDGDDEELLGFVAEALLLREARGEDATARDGAIVQLSLAGTRGRGPLEQLAAAEGPSALGALVALARVGDRGSRRLLRGMADSADASVRAASVLGMSAEEDRALLVSWCADPSREVRDAACARLAELAPDGEVMALLVERSRIDPEAGVRAAATRALGRFGAQAALPLRDRLSDADPRVRSAALESLLRADREAGRQAVASLLATPTSAITVEAARLVATPLEPAAPPSEADLLAARTHLLGALTLADATLRGQAAMALVALSPDDDTTGALLPLVDAEPDVGVRLSLARALFGRRSARERARASLARLLAEDHGMTGAQAAVVLAAAGDEDGVARLRAELSSPEPSVRRVVVRALARDAMRPTEVREQLRDPDAAVRISAAGGVLAALAARE
jgi:HEAT repeat protein